MLPLYYPKTFINASLEEMKEVCNGCGAKDGVNVPDTMWGLKVTKPCNIHDWMFHKGTTLGDYYFANVMFFWNLTATIIDGSNWFTMLPRMKRALKYFLAVLTKAGTEAYWVDKRYDDRMNITIRGEFL